MAPISSSSSPSSTYSQFPLWRPEGEGSSSKGKERADIDQIVDIDGDHSDSWQSLSESEPESEGSEKLVLLADHKKIVGKHKKKHEEVAAKNVILARAIITGEVRHSGGKDIGVTYQETVNDYVTTGTDTDALSTKTRSRHQHPKVTFIQKQKQKIAVLTQAQKEEQALRLDREREIKAKDQEIEAARQRVEALEAQKREAEEALRAAEEKRERAQMIARNSNIHGTKDSKGPVEIEFYPINPLDSPLERITSYFKDLKYRDLVMQTVLQLLTGIILRHKKTGKELSDSLDKDAVEVYEIIRTANTQNGIYKESEHGGLRKHYERIKECLEGIGPESDISDINEKILAAIKGRFYKNQKGQLIVRLKTEAEKLIPIYLEKIEKVKRENYLHSEAYKARNNRILLLVLALNPKGIPAAQRSLIDEAAKKASEPISIEHLQIKEALWKLVTNLQELYKKYDGLQLRNKKGSPLERLNSYLGILEDENLIKKTILQLFTGMVLHSKKTGEPLPALPNEDVLEIHALVERGIRALDSLNGKDAYYWDLNRHYERIKFCFKKIGESDIEYLKKIIDERIEEQFNGNNSPRLTNELGKLVQEDPSYLVSKHTHNENCKTKTSISFLRFFFPSHNRAVCSQQELNSLTEKLNELYERYNNLKWRKSIRSQKMPVREPANQQEGPSSSGYAAAPEHLESTTASSSTLLLSQ